MNVHYELPFDFVLRELYPFRPIVRKLYGGYALLRERTLLMLLRESDTHPEFNGVFVATRPAFFAALQQEIHASKMEFDLDGEAQSWIFISEDLDDFEAKVRAACQFIKNGDERVGKILD